MTKRSIQLGSSDVFQLLIQALVKDFHYKKFLSYCFPSLSIVLFTLFYGWVDGYVVSHLLQDRAYQCINFVGPFIFCFSLLGFVLSTCASALIDSALEKNDFHQASQLFTKIIVRQFEFGLFVSAFFLLFMTPFIYALASNRWMAGQAFQYVLPLILSLSFFFLANSYQSFLVAAGKSRLSLILCIGCSLWNSLLDYLLIHLLGISGAAWATVFNWLLGAILPTIWFWRHPEAPLHFLKEEI